MFGKKFLSVIEGFELDNPAEDCKSAIRIGQYKVSNLAIYKPDGSYLPFEKVTDTVCDKTSVHVSGCCAGGVPVERIIFVTDAGKYPFIFDTAKDVSRVLEKLNK